MTSRYSAIVTVSAGDRTRAVYDSINIDNKFYPENPVHTEIKLDGALVICAESENIAHLRANLNSTLRLIQAGYDSLDSA